MQIWVDADACPGEVKELLFRAARRTKTKVTLIANQAMRTPRLTRGHRALRGARFAKTNGTDHRRQVRRSGDHRSRRGLASPATRLQPGGRSEAGVATGW